MIKEIKVLNGLRAIAALFVLFAHFPKIDIPFVGEIIYRLPRFLYLGFIGVDLFFVLSGFLITSIAIK
jgi:peptidoglycan/LPS O-acetylase OafA/YrhL